MSTSSKQVSVTYAVRKKKTPYAGNSYYYGRKFPDDLHPFASTDRIFHIYLAFKPKGRCPALFLREHFFHFVNLLKNTKIDITTHGQ